MTAPRLRLALACCLIGGLALGCTDGRDTTAPEPQPSEQSDTGGVHPAVPPEYRELSAAFARFRQIDACGLHDVAAARAAAEGDQADEIVPGDDGLHECTLLLNRGEFVRTWTIYLTVGAEFDAEQRRQAAPEQAGPMQVYTYLDEQTCRLNKPLDDAHSIEMTVRAPDPEDSQKPPCEYALQYATAVADLWSDPPQRGSGRTAPDLPLGALDPCEAAAAVLDDIGDGAILVPDTPYSCQARPSPDLPPTRPEGALTDAVTVTYLLDEDPVADLAAHTGQTDSRQATVGDRTAVIAQSTGACTTQIVWDPDTTVVVDARADDAPASVQLIEVETPTCEIAQPLAEQVLAEAGKK